MGRLSFSENMHFKKSVVSWSHVGSVLINEPFGFTTLMLSIDE